MAGAQEKYDVVHVAAVVYAPGPACTNSLTILTVALCSSCTSFDDSCMSDSNAAAAAVPSSASRDAVRSAAAA